MSPLKRQQLLELANRWQRDSDEHGPHGDAAYATQAASALYLCAVDLRRELGVENPYAKTDGNEEPTP